MIVFDTECFKFNWMLVALDLVKKEKTVIIDDAEALRKFHEAHKDDIWIGHNVRGFDQFIVKGILCGFNPYDISQFIIVEGRKGHEFSKLLNNIPLNFYDTLTASKLGLKTLEGFMGESIEELGAVDWDIDRPLTDEELKITLDYCTHDVEQTAMVLSKKNVMNAFLAQLEVVKMFGLTKADMGRTEAQLTAKVLEAKRPFHDRNDELEFEIPPTLRIKKYQFVVDWFVRCRDDALECLRNGEDRDEVFKDFYSQKLECEIAGVPHVFAWGGIHGAKPNYIDRGYFVLADVNSFYPSMMIQYHYHSRNVKDPQRYVDIYNARIEHKRNKDPREKAEKLLLNATYGALKDKYNGLYDPRQANNVCVTGQLLLLDLIEHLEDRFDIYNVNTDGVAVKLRATNDDKADVEYAELDRRCREWEKRTRMTLGFEEYESVVQRDVNNFVMVTPDGEIKSKGGVVKKLNDLDYDLAIINEAVVNYFVHGVPVEETVNGCNDLRKFQKVYKISSAYKYAQHNGEAKTEKVFRVFASKDETDTPLYKVKDKGERGLVPEKFAGCPDHCFIDNGHVLGKAIPAKLDRSWYVTEAKRRIAQFVGTES